MLLALGPTPGEAHPHVFIDGGVDFVFDAGGELTQLRVTWVYDAMNTLLMLGDIGIDAQTDADLSPEQRSQLARYQTEWDADFDGDSYLWDGPRRIGLSGPVDATASLRDGRAVFTFLRTVSTPFRPGRNAVVKVYDPTYYTEYTVTEAPRLEGNAKGCHATVEPFKPTPKLTALLNQLSTVPIDQTPAENVGELLADKIRIACE